MTSTLTPLAVAPVTADALHLPTPGAVSAAVPLFVIGLLLWRRVLPRLAAMLALLAGAALNHGWLFTAIHGLLGGTTAVINIVSRTTLGSVVPGALAMVMAIYYALAIKLDSATVNRLLAARHTPLRTLRRGSYAGSYAGGGWGGSTLALAGGEDGGRPRWPRKLGALAVGLALPAVITTIPGTVGTVAQSAVNLIGGLMAAGLDHTIGIR